MEQGHDIERLQAEYKRRREHPSTQRYSLFNPAHLYTIQQRQRRVVELLRHEGITSLAGKRVLELGCGSGGVLHELLSYGAQPALLHGAELLEWRVKEASALLPPAVGLVNADGRYLPYPDASFEIVAQFTVFTSILDPEIKRRLASEMRRVLRTGGLILWYDFWLNPTNPQTKGIRAKELCALFDGATIRMERVTLAPPIARLLARRSWLACYLLERLRLLNTHYLAAIKLNNSAAPKDDHARNISSIRPPRDRK